MNNSVCKFKNDCSGCSQWDVGRPDQITSKKDSFLELTAGFKRASDFRLDFIDLGHSQVRDRLDFVIEDGRIGLYGPITKKIVDLPECLMLTPALQSFYSEFRKIKFPIKKGSVRLRIGPAGQKGIWLDFSNVDIKNLLESKSELQQCLSLGFVEIGQKRKCLKVISDTLKLKDPEFNNWTTSLKSCVGSFSQTGHKSIQALSEVVANYANQSKNIIEFGSGFGEMTFPLAGEVRLVKAFELETLSTDALKLNIEEKQKQKQIQVFTGDFQKEKADLKNIDTVFVNPPRSGVGKFLNDLVNSEDTKTLIYMSCFVESMIKDTENLNQNGFILKKACIVDQFPQTSHYEVIALFQRQS